MIKSKTSIVKLLLLGIALLILGSTKVLANISVSLPTLTRQVGATSDFQYITIGDITGQNVTAFQFEIDYNKNIVFIDSAFTSGIAASGNGFFSFNADTANGKLKVAWASGSPLSGSGAIVRLKVHYINAGNTALTFNTTFSKLNAGTPAINFTNGNVLVASVSVNLGNVNGTTGDTVLIPVVTSALTTNENVMAFNFVAAFNPAKVKLLSNVVTTGTLGAGGLAQVNPNNTTGTVNVAWAIGSSISGAGTLLYLQAVLLGTATTDTMSFSTFQYNAGDPAVSGNYGIITINAPIIYPPHFNVIAAQNGKEGTLLSFTVAATSSNNIALTYSSDNATSAQGSVFDAATQKFSWTPDFLQEGSYAVKFYVTNGATSDITTVSISIANSNRVPTLTLSPEDPSITINQGDSLAITLIGVDPDLDNVLTYSGSSLMNGMVTTVSNSPVTGKGLFVFKPSYSQSGIFVDTITVRDDRGASASAYISITVNAVNNPPSWAIAGACQMPDTVLLVGQTLRFTYKAIDPQGRTVTYFLSNPAPTGSSIDQNTGVFTWTPTKADTGNFQVLIMASNGVSTSVSSINSISVKGLVGIQTQKSGIPSEYSLIQNYPNPFNPTTLIRYDLPKAGLVTLKVYDLLGREVATLINGNQAAGRYSVQFNASAFASGVYIYRIQSNNFSAVKKLMLLK